MTRWDQTTTRGPQQPAHGGVRQPGEHREPEDRDGDVDGAEQGVPERGRAGRHELRHDRHVEEADLRVEHVAQQACREGAARRAGRARPVQRAAAGPGARRRRTSASTGAARGRRGSTHPRPGGRRARRRIPRRRRRVPRRPPLPRPASRRRHRRPWPARGAARRGASCAGPGRRPARVRATASASGRGMPRCRPPRPRSGPAAQSRTCPEEAPRRLRMQPMSSASALTASDAHDLIDDDLPHDAHARGAGGAAHLRRPPQRQQRPSPSCS